MCHMDSDFFFPLLQEDELTQSENSASIFNTLSDIPSQIEDADVLLREAMRVAGSLTDVAVETQRRKHLAYLIADQGQLLNPSAAVNNISKVSVWGLPCPCSLGFQIPFIALPSGLNGPLLSAHARPSCVNWL